MPNYDERAVARALENTTHSGYEADITEITISAADLKALRACALARRDNDGREQMSLTLEELDSEIAVYGPTEAARVQISRNAYDRLLRPGILWVRIDREDT